ncbi:beta-defensin 1-like [Eptesicus fuscus]|uniref:beta-defensin 1-like n=1 Tax=Eptesicus fuscus TaxID=29078 RepID=UPI002403E335|nr:beta-defensin 1-like [Eptesicus fuscus]
MRLFHILLLPLCLLFAQVGPGAGLLLVEVPKSPEHMCIKKRGHCYFNPCPTFLTHDGYCFRGKAKCCYWEDRGR